MDDIQTNNRPLIVDLDGTLVATDTLFESCLLYLKKKPLELFTLLKWAWTGKAKLKEQLSQQVLPNPALLPYRENVIDFANKAKSSGREVYLITGANQKIADSISEVHELFSAVTGSSNKVNLIGKDKLSLIVETVASQEFDYIGNSRADLPIWKASKKAIVCSGSKRLLKKVKKINKNVISIKKKSLLLRHWIKELRLYQWSKNILVFLALLMSHRIFEFPLLINSVLAFISFSLIASSVYILNDLFDLEADRRHPSKRNRPFAAGKIQVIQGIRAIPILILLGFLLSILFLPNLLTLTLLVYLIITTTYSLYLKEIKLLDVILLGTLYTLRIIAGGFATGIEVSSWLLVFSGFFFLSLAFMKRYTDLILFKKSSQEELFGRGYGLEDTKLVQGAGIASGIVSLFVLALYVTSEQVLLLYTKPILLWLTIPLILFWLMNMWYMAHKGKMTDDPIIYAVKDRNSYIVFFLTIFIIIIATII